MRAAVYRGPNQLLVEDRPDPMPGAGEVLLEVHACGVCGSDLHAIASGWPSVGSVMGHEPSGVVAAVGEGVRHVAPGDRVAVVPSAACGDCSYCRQGFHNLCTGRRGAGGAYAERVVLPEGTPIFRLPDTVALEEGALLEPLSVAVRSVRVAAVSPTSRCAVVGLGAIGQCVVQVLRAAGVSDVVGIDVAERRLELARQSGARHVINAAGGGVAEALRDRFGGGEHRGYSYADVDVVFECSGSLQVIREVFERYVRPSGTVVMVALFEEDVSFDANPVVRKEVTVRGSYAYSDEDINQAAALISEREVDMSALITHVVPLESIGDALTAQHDKDGSVKVLVAPNRSA